MSDDPKKPAGPPVPPSYEEHLSVLSPELREELQRTHRKIFSDRAEALERARRRAGLSVDELAKEMGFKGASSIQRYLSPDYYKSYRPEIARAFRAALLGKGNPPITDDDLVLLLQGKELEPSDPSYRQRQEISGRLLQNGRAVNFKEGAAANRMHAQLPLMEGDVLVEMPHFMSPKSLAAFRAWMMHLIEYAEDSAKFSDVVNNIEDPTWGKRW